MKKLFLMLSFMFFLGCSTDNHVERIEQPNSIVKYKENTIEPKRFSNLYGNNQAYPETCLEDCYPPSENVVCQLPAEKCKFTGENPQLALNAGVNIRWLGHASFHIKNSDGTNFLFDPVSGQFDWPVNWAFRLSNGFNRQSPEWLTEQEINKVDAVLYSHIHYDHFNKSDISTIGSKPKYYVPLGFAEHFEKDGYAINEMVWFSKTSLNETTINFVPAHHFSSRILVPYIYEDNDTTLWGGWVIEHQGKRLFFAGDTGYSPHFKDIQQRYGDMDICLMPIASYYHKEHGKWYRNVHTTPEDALVAANELNCKVMIPWGYGNSSWKMGDHSSHSPLLRLLKMHKSLKSEIPLYILNEGEDVQL